MKINSRYIIAGISFIVAIALLWYFNQLVSYIVIAWVLSMIGAPIFKLFNKKLGTSLSSALTLVTFTIILILFFSVVVPPLVKQARNLTSIDYNSIIESLEEPLSDIETWLEKRGLMHPSTQDSIQELPMHSHPNQLIVERIRLDSLTGNPSDSSNITLLINVHNDYTQEQQKEIKQEEDLLMTLRNNLISYLDPSSIPQLFGSALGFISNLMIAILSIFFIAFFFLKEKGLFLRMIQSILPDEYESNASNAIDESSSLLVRYFIGIITQVSIITILASIALSILGIKNALLIGLIAGMMNVIPYIGPFIGMAFGTFITISSNVDLSFYDGIMPNIIKVIIVLAVLQMLDNFLLQPTIFSKSVKAHPLEIFLIVLIGAQLGGILGMVLAIPFYTVLRVLGKVFFSEYKIIQRITQDI